MSGLEIHFRRVCQGNVTVGDRKNTLRVDGGHLHKETFGQFTFRLSAGSISRGNAYPGIV